MDGTNGTYATKGTPSSSRGLYGCGALPELRALPGTAPDFRKSDPHPNPLPSDGRGDSDWMSAVICQRVVRNTMGCGSPTGGSVRMRPGTAELTEEKLKLDRGGEWAKINP